jgi:hypothetical protein
MPIAIAPAAADQEPSSCSCHGGQIRAEITLSPRRGSLGGLGTQSTSLYTGTLVYKARSCTRCREYGESVGESRERCLRQLVT